MTDSIETSEREAVPLPMGLAVLPASPEPFAYHRAGWGPDCGPYTEFYTAKEMEHRDKAGWTPLYKSLEASEPVAALAKVSFINGEWEGAEEWMPLAWHLCAEECGEEACTELIWEGGPIPEPWGDRWLKYEDQAKEMMALVRRLAPPHPSLVNQMLVEALQYVIDDLEYRASMKPGDAKGLVDIGNGAYLQARAALAAAKREI